MPYDGPHVGASPILLPDFQYFSTFVVSEQQYWELLGYACLLGEISHGVLATYKITKILAERSCLATSKQRSRVPPP